MSETQKLTPEEIKTILATHLAWLRNEAGGSQANLSYADLSYADLSYANLRDANLRDANLRDANLSYADLRDANLRYANLSGANLSGADLSYADLRDANLRVANLRDANLHDANLRAAKNGSLILATTEILPREGEVYGWKQCRNGVLVRLRVPPDARRSNATGRKCRAEWVETQEVVAADGSPVDVGISLHDSRVTYRKGETTRAANGWEENRLVECGAGIHFFLTREEAEAY